MAAVSRIQRNFPPVDWGWRTRAGQSQPINWALWPLLAFGYVSLLVGVARRGKSLFSLAVSLATATGRWPHGCFTASKPTPTVFMSLEDSLAIVDERLTNLQGPGVAPPSTWGPVHDGMEFDLSDEGDLEQLEEWIVANGILVLIIDNLTYLHRQEEDDSTAMRPVISGLVGIAERRQVAILLIHHLRKMGKGGDEGTIVDRARGSGIIAASCPVVAGFERKDSDPVATLTLASKFAKGSGTYSVSLNDSTTPYLWHVYPKPPDPPKSKHRGGKSVL